MVSFVLMALAAPCFAQERIHAVNQSQYVQFDPTTGYLLGTGFIQGLTPGHFLQSSAFDGTWIYARDGYYDQLWRIHPANMTADLLGPMGFGPVQLNNYSFEWVPQLDSLVLLFGDEVYFVDRVTGAATLQATLSGLAQYDAIAAFAVATDGSVVGLGADTTLQPGIGVYDVDFSTMSVNLQAYIIQPGNPRVLDVAYDSTDRLWATVVASPSSAHGYYQIDLNSFVMTQVIQTFAIGAGLSIGPATTSTTYCTAKLTSNGCVPTISGSGLASPTATSGYPITGSNARNQSAGMLTFGMAGRTAVPFAGGTLCVAPPRMRGGVTSSGGSALPALDCSGVWSMDFNTWISTLPALPPGTTVNAQWLGRDNGYTPPNNLQLSNGLEFTLIP
jgi:hypothetical protein